MNRLVVISNPKENSFCHALANSYIKATIEKKYNIDIIDLYKTDLKQDFLKLNENDDTVERDIIQKKITWADEIAFFTPMWWGHVPAILKNFIDVNFSSGFAYKNNKGGIVNRLLKGKSVVVIVTSDTPKFIYWLLDLPIRIIFGFITFKYCGMSVRKFKVFPSIRKSRLKQRKGFLNYVYNLGMKDF